MALKTIFAPLAICAGLLTSSAAFAATVTFNFPTSGYVKTSSATVTSDGVTLTIDNPVTGFQNGNQFGFPIGGGLFLDGGAATGLDLTFSEDIRLVSYTLIDEEGSDIDSWFDLTQGTTQSDNNTVNTLGVHAFSNTADVFLGSTAINLLSSTIDPYGYVFSSITVETISAVPLPATGLFLVSGLFGLSRLGRRKA